MPDFASATFWQLFNAALFRSRIMEREHFKVLYEANTDDIGIHPEPGRVIFDAATSRFGTDSVRRDSEPSKGGLIDYPVLERDGRVVSARAKSQVLSSLPSASFDYVYIEPSLAHEAKKWIERNREKVLRKAAKKEEESA